MNFRGVSLFGAVVTALALASAPASAQEPAPWEAGAQPAEEGAAAEPAAEPAPEPQPAPEPAPAPAAAPMEEPEDAGNVPPVGAIGIGYFTTSAPLGVRMWLNDKIGIDAGVGLRIDSTPEDVGWGLSMEGGLLYSLKNTENMIIFARGGVGVGLSDSGQPASDVQWGVELNGMLGAEFFMGALGFPNLSFSAGVGLGIELLESPVDGDFGVRILSKNAPANIVAAGVLGFHVYL